jgi:hypothetical protein
LYEEFEDNKGRQSGEFRCSGRVGISLFLEKDIRPKFLEHSEAGNAYPSRAPEFT